MSRRRAVSRHGFSLAALLLAITIIAVSLAIVRVAIQRQARAEPTVFGQANAMQMLLVVVVGCGLVGGVFALVLAVWSRMRWFYVLASPMAGIFVGAGAAALATLPLGWPVICTLPAVLIVSAMLLVRPKRPPEQNAERPS